MPSAVPDWRMQASLPQSIRWAKPPPPEFPLTDSAIAVPSSDSVLHHRPFALFLLSRTFSNLAFQLQAVAIGWQVYGMTGSAFALGMVGLAEFVPALFLAFVVGHVADRFDRRLIVQLCQLVQGMAITG